MRILSLFCILCFCALHTAAQKHFELKLPDTLTLKQKFLKSNYDFNITLAYLENNYSSNSKKTAIKTDPDFNNKECGFTKKFASNIEYTYYDCGEASPVKEEIIFPKVPLSTVKKWVELMYSCYPMDIPNVWYPKKNEYGPKDKEAGCYYTITEKENKTVINTWCGS